MTCITLATLSSAQAMSLTMFWKRMTSSRSSPSTWAFTRRPKGIGGCFRSVDLSSDDPPKFITIDEETNHQIMHALIGFQGHGI